MPYEGWLDYSRRFAMVFLFILRTTCTEKRQSSVPMVLGRNLGSLIRSLSILASLLWKGVMIVVEKNFRSSFGSFPFT